jgi:arginyl-tRNA synthetase
VSLPSIGDVDFSCLEQEDELALAKQLARFPETIAGAAENHEPHRIVFYLQELASQFHSYYNRTKVLVDDQPTSQARLYLVNCVRIVLENALHLLGVSAPESM